MPVIQILICSLVFVALAIFLLKLFKVALAKRAIILSLGLSLVFSSLSFFYRIPRVGGTIRYNLHGWPHFYYWHGIGDVVDNITLNEWSFSPGSFYIYLIANFLFYFSAVLLLVVLIQIIKNKNFTKTQVIAALLAVVAAVALIGWSLQGNKKRYLPPPAATRGVGDLLSSGKNQAEKNEAWLSVKRAIFECEVKSVMQTHAREVTVELKSGGELRAFEPEIDEVFTVVQSTQDKCGRIIMATE